MAEPVYLAQTGETRIGKERNDWISSRVAEARKTGCTWGRVTLDEERNLLLYEGWLERPKDEGEPRWQMEATS